MDETLEFAVQDGHYGFVQNILENGDFSINVLERSLDLARDHGHQYIVQYLENHINNHAVAGAGEHTSDSPGTSDRIVFEVPRNGDLYTDYGYFSVTLPRVSDTTRFVGRYNHDICEGELSSSERSWLEELIRRMFPHERIDVSYISDIKLCNFIRLNSDRLRHSPQTSCQGLDPIMGDVTGQRLEDLPFYHIVKLYFPRDSDELAQCYSRYSLMEYLEQNEYRLPNDMMLTYESIHVLRTSPHRTFNVVLQEDTCIYKLIPIDMEVYFK